MIPIVEYLALRLRDRLPAITAKEPSECALACIAMVATFYGHRSDVASLRRAYPSSVNSATPVTIMETANQLQLSTRAVRVDAGKVRNLRRPAILGLRANHYVVLKSIGWRHVTVVDPTKGERNLSISELNNNFSGIAIELWPNPRFEPVKTKQKVRLRDLLGPITGLRRSLAQIVMLALALEAFALVSPFFIQWVIDDVLVSGDHDLLTTLAIGFGLLMVLQHITTAIRSWLIIYLGTTLKIQWQSNVFGHLLRLPGEYFETRHMGDVVSRFSSIESIQRTLTASFIEAILDGTMTAATLAMIFVYSPRLSALPISAVCLYVVCRSLWYRPLRTATEEQIVQAAKQQTHFMESVRGIRPIKLFERYEERRTGWLSLLVDQLNADLRIQKLQMFYRLVNSLLFGTEDVAIIWLGSEFVLNQTFSVGMLMAFISYKWQFLTRVSLLVDKYFEIKMLQLQGERLADIVLSPEESSSSTRRLVLSERNSMDLNIEARDISFRYGEHDPFVLNGVTLRVCAGESVAITGPSGCGKTTLIHLMLGLRTPTAGEIFIGGSNIAHLGLETLRSLVGAVMQDDTLFAGSITDNISFFDTRAEQSWVEECAKIACVHRDIVAMPKGYNTSVGDMGSVLSGGQKQRVLLARALYKRPRILFLDEATSHLDVELELAVNSAIRAMRVTRVIVAHRPQTIETTDRQIHLDQGRVMELQGVGNLPSSLIASEVAK